MLALPCSGVALRGVGEGDRIYVRNFGTVVAGDRGSPLGSAGFPELSDVLGLMLLH